MFRVLAAALAALTAAADAPAPPITAPPAALHADPFYARYLDAGGIPILSSAKVSDEALRRTRAIVVAMLAHRPDIARALAAWGQRVAVMAPSETTTDLPEQRDWKKPARDDPRLTRCERKHYDERIGAISDQTYWDNRARGMSGRLTSAAEENVLGWASSRYYGETIFVHEFAHDILFTAKEIDPRFYARVEAAYAHALATGLWKDEYTVTTVDEYWAEGSQFWFDSNRVQSFDGRRILSDADLSAYDPALAAVLREGYGEVHRLPGDAFWQSPARVPPGVLPASTAEVC